MDKNYGLFGLAVQSGDTAAAKPLITFPASDSSEGIDSAISTDDQKLTIGGRDTTVARLVSSVDGTAKVTTLAFADLLQYALYSALGSDTVSGSASPWTHDLKMADGDLPAMTFFQQIGSTSATLQELTGCKMQSLTLSASGVNPLALDFTFAGCEAKWLEGTTTWNGPAFKPSDGWFTVAGASVLFSAADSDATTPDASIVLSSVEFSIENTLSSVTKLGEVEASKQKEGSATVKCTIEGTTTDTGIQRLIKTGSKTGTGVSKSIVTGAVQVTFKHSVHTDYSLVLKIPAIPWAIDALSVHPDGGAFDLKLDTDGAIAVDGTSIEALLTCGIETALD